jgi:hypothetical protein
MVMVRRCLLGRAAIALAPEIDLAEMLCFFWYGIILKKSR